jgi:hypothetical protein
MAVVYGLDVERSLPLAVPKLDETMQTDAN